MRKVCDLNRQSVPCNDRPRQSSLDCRQIPSVSYLSPFCNVYFQLPPHPVKLMNATDLLTATCRQPNTSGKSRWPYLVYLSCDPTISLSSCSLPLLVQYYPIIKTNNNQVHPFPEAIPLCVYFQKCFFSHQSNFVQLNQLQSSTSYFMQY